MASEAQLLPASRYRVRTPEERDRAFLAAKRHSRNVALLRKVLPAVGVMVLAAYFVSSRMNVTVGGVTASVSGVEVTGGVLRMVNPTLKGVDKKNGAYVVSADYADQDIDSPKLIRLHKIKAELSTESKDWSRMQAVRGLFNSAKETLVMQDEIQIETSSGITGSLSRATLDMKKQILRSHQPVAFDLPGGTVRARAMTLDSGDKTLLFRGQVKVHIKKREKAQVSAAAQPPQVKAPEAPARISPEAGSAPPPDARLP